MILITENEIDKEPLNMYNISKGLKVLRIFTIFIESTGLRGIFTAINPMPTDKKSSFILHKRYLQVTHTLDIIRSLNLTWIYSIRAHGVFLLYYFLRLYFKANITQHRCTCIYLDVEYFSRRICLTKNGMTLHSYSNFS